VPFFRHPLLPALLCALLWGSAFPSIKTVYRHWEAAGLERTLSLVFLFAGIRFCLAGLGLLFFGKNLRQEMKVTPWKFLVGLALTQTFIQYVFFYQAIAVSSASLTALLVVTGSFWWVILAPILQKTPRPSQRQWLGLALGGVGVTLSIYQPGAGAGNPLLGAIFMMSATANGALAIILFSHIKPKMSAINATGLSLFLGGLGLTALGLPAVSKLPEMLDTTVIFITLWLSLVSAAAFSIWNHLSTLFPVPLLANYRFFIPVCGVIEALILLPDESAGWGLLLGGPLVIASMIWAKRSA